MNPELQLEENPVEAFTPLTPEERAALSPEEAINHSMQLMRELPPEVATPTIDANWIGNNRFSPFMKDLMILSRDDGAKYGEAITLAAEAGMSREALHFKITDEVGRESYRLAITKGFRRLSNKIFGS